MAPGVRLRAWHRTLERLVGQTMTIGVRADDVRVDPSGPVRMTADRLTFEDSRRYRVLRSAAGTITTADTDLVEGATVHARFIRWHLFDTVGRRIATVG